VAIKEKCCKIAGGKKVEKSFKNIFSVVSID
jgi:hypothetical protein